MVGVRMREREEMMVVEMRLGEVMVRMVGVRMWRRVMVRMEEVTMRKG